MPIPKELSLTPEQLDEMMTASWNMRIATVGPGSRINLTPLWFGWAGGNGRFRIPQKNYTEDNEDKNHRSNCDWNKWQFADRGWRFN